MKFKLSVVILEILETVDLMGFSQKNIFRIEFVCLDTGEQIFKAKVDVSG